MKIMFAVPSYWPSQDGVANITGYLAEGLAAKGHEVLIFTSAGNGGLQDLPEKEVNKKVLIERMRVYVRWPLKLKGRDSKSTRAYYLARIKEYNPDILVVVCSQTWTLDWLRGSLDKIFCPKIFYCHGYSRWMDHYEYWNQLKHRNILGVWEQYLCKRYYDKLYSDIEKFDLAIYLSEQNNAVRYSQIHDLKNGKILENAIEDAFFRPEMKHNYSKEKQGEITFLFVANYSENKNHKLLIEAYAKADIGKSKLIFAGFEENAYSDYLKQYTKQIIAEDSEKDVVFHVHLTRGQIIDLYRTADIFTCSSMSETWSIVAHEAAAVAMPIISTDVGIYSEIDGVMLIHSVDEMKRAMELLYYNPDERKRRGEAAYSWLQKKRCRTSDKIEWLEKEMKRLIAERGNCGQS